MVIPGKSNATSTGQVIPAMDKPHDPQVWKKHFNFRYPYPSFENINSEGCQFMWPLCSQCHWPPLPSMDLSPLEV